MRRWLVRLALAGFLVSITLVGLIVGVGAWLPGHVAVPETRLEAGAMPQPLAETVWPTAEEAAEDPYGWWEAERGRREAYRQAWFAAHPNETRAFTEEPVGAIGMPLLVFRVLPEIMPDRWKAFPADRGMHPRTDPEAFLPKELTFGPGANPISSLPGYDQVRMPAVGTTCSSCHRGHVRGPDGATIELLGAPNATLNIHRHYTLLTENVLDERLTAEAVVEALDRHPLGWAYGPGWENQERIDRLLFSMAGGQIIDTMRRYAIEGEARVDATLVGFTYAGDGDAFRKDLWGQTEMGLLVALLVPSEVWKNPSVTDDPLVKYLPAGPASVDYRHIWRQDQRFVGHYDGSTASKPMRNIAAALGATGVPEFVHAEHAIEMTTYIDHLPAPAYPFPVDAMLALQGKWVFDKACAECHGVEEVLVGVHEVGTDPNRALALTEKGRETLIAAIRTSCGDHPECDEPDERIVKLADAPRGYIAAPLTGVWATAPYLHNGSVPTLYHLLVPEARPTTFRRGSEDYDQTRVGFRWDGVDGVRWDTTRPGLSNAGHSDIDVFFGGIDFAVDDGSRMALLEYLKTL